MNATTETLRGIPASADAKSGRIGLVDILEMAVFALKGNWLRSVLTALGVIIGIAAVIVMVSVGQGTQAELDRTIANLGSNRVEVWPGSGRGGGVRFGAGSTSSLDDGDIAAIRAEVPGVLYVAGQIRGAVQAVNAERNWNTQWIGVMPDYFPTNGWEVETGSEFGARDYSAAAKVALIGTSVRDRLFEGEDPIGAQIRLGRVPFTVVGVLKSKGQSGWGGDMDDVVMVPLETARRRLAGSMGLPPGTVTSISVGAARAEDLPAVEQGINELLRQRHRIQPGAEDDFTVRNLTEIVSARTQTTRLMSLLLGAVATISLIVGGIGIMNIMLVSVTERIREIGLRMSVGAGPREIQLQFLAEAMMLSLGGGVIGIVLGIIGTQVVSQLGALPVALNLQVIALATGFSIATGLFFGYYPARKAAQLDPIEALRHQG
jgi:putative ABC transport system permease protein